MQVTLQWQLSVLGLVLCVRLLFLHARIIPSPRAIVRQKRSQRIQECLPRPPVCLSPRMWSPQHLLPLPPRASHPLQWLSPPIHLDRFRSWVHPLPTRPSRSRSWCGFMAMGRQQTSFSSISSSSNCRKKRGSSLSLPTARRIRRAVGSGTQAHRAATSRKLPWMTSRTFEGSLRPQRQDTPWMRSECTWWAIPTVGSWHTG